MPRNFSSIPGAFWCRAGAGISAPFPVSALIHRDFGGHGGIPWELKFRPCAQGEEHVLVTTQTTAFGRARD